MQNRIGTVMLVLISLFILTACAQNRDYQYYMEHPEKIPAAYSACQKKKTSSCDDVFKAAKKMRALLENLLSDRLAFGQTVMAAETTLAKAKNDFKIANPTQKPKARTNLKKAQAKVNVLLATIRISSEDWKQ